jgi:spermidine synthase
MVTQATSPFFANKAFWCIVQTMETAFSEQVIKGAVYPYHVNVPSFGEWGFVLAAKRTKKWDDIEITVETRFLTTERLPSLFVFGRDIERVESESNQLLHPILYHYYRKGWSRFN